MSWHTISNYSSCICGQLGWFQYLYRAPVGSGSATQSAHTSRISWLAKACSSRGRGRGGEGQTEHTRLLEDWAWNEHPVTSVHMPLAQVSPMTSPASRTRKVHGTQSWKKYRLQGKWHGESDWWGAGTDHLINHRWRIWRSWSCLEQMLWSLWNLPEPYGISLRRVSSQVLLLEDEIGIMSFPFNY